MVDSPFANNNCTHRHCPEHCCNTDGLWWGDEEYPAIAYKIWTEYCDKMHEFREYRDDIATALGIIHKTVMGDSIVPELPKGLLG